MAEAGEIFHGTIKVYFALKGFGFITRTAGKDIFFVRKNVLSEEMLVPGVSVSFNVAMDERGLNAVNVRRAG